MYISYHLKAFLIQFVDYFWRNSSRKQLVVDILNVVIKEKMSRNLTEKEFTDLDDLLSKRSPTTASTHRIYLVYIEERFPKPIEEVIDLRNDIFHDQILHYATITRDLKWICDIYPAYDVFTDHMKKALKHIAPSLIEKEWIQLFEFLRMYYYNNQVINHLREAISKQLETNCDKKFMILTLLKIVTNYLLIPTRYSSFDYLINSVFDLRFYCFIYFSIGMKHWNVRSL